MSAPVIPPGGTIVQTFKKSFVDVPIDEANGRAVSTSEFLEAAESLTTIFGKWLLFLTATIYYAIVFFFAKEEAWSA